MEGGPFLGVVTEATFTAPSGRVLTREAFWDGGGALHGGLGAHPTEPGPDAGVAVPMVWTLVGQALYEPCSTLEEMGTRLCTAMLRRVAYTTVQLGRAGYTYGAQGIWDCVWEHGETGPMGSSSTGLTSPPNPSTATGSSP